MVSEGRVHVIVESQEIVRRTEGGSSYFLLVEMVDKGCRLDQDHSPKHHWCRVYGFYEACNGGNNVCYHHCLHSLVSKYPSYQRFALLARTNEQQSLIPLCY